MLANNSLLDLLSTVHTNVVSEMTGLSSHWLQKAGASSGSFIKTYIRESINSDSDSDTGHSKYITSKDDLWVVLSLKGKDDFLRREQT